jgi:hypothetical protein
VWNERSKAAAGVVVSCWRGTAAGGCLALQTLDKRPDMMFRSVLGPSISGVLNSALAALVRMLAGVRLGALRCPKRR